MKKMNTFLMKIGLVAAVAVLSFGCAKDKGEKQPESFTRTVKVTMTKGEPGNVGGTKTTVVEGPDKAAFYWTDGDQENFNIYENGAKGTIKGVEFSSDMKKITLEVEFDSNVAEEYVYTAKYASELSNSGNPKLSASQNPLENSYDPEMDILIAEEKTSATALTSLRLVMNRVVSVNKMTLTGLEAGEKISSVEFELDKVVAGAYQESGTFTGSDRKLTFNYDDAEVGADGTFPVYFVCAPVEEAAIKGVSVKTDKNSYLKPASAFEGKSISLTLDKMLRFTMDMEGYGSEAGGGNVFTLVEKQADLAEGLYLIAAADFDVAAGTLSSNSKYLESVGITKSADSKTITLEETSAVVPVTLVRSGNNWQIKVTKTTDPNNGKYVAWSSGNSCSIQDATYDWVISVNDGVAVIKAGSDNNRMLQYNNSSPRFACYLASSNQNDVALYYNKNGGTPVEPGDPAIKVVSANPMSVSSQGGVQSISYTVTNPVSGVNATATSNVSWISSISVQQYTITFNVDGQEDEAPARTGVITIKYEGAEDVSVTVNQESGTSSGMPANGWLELPATTSGSDYFSGTFYAGSDRNYTYLYQYSTYTSLWTAYPLYRSTVSSSAPLGPVMYSEEDRASWKYNPQIDKTKQVNLSSSYGVNYGNTIYSRGHQIPNGDRKNNSTMQSQTYYFTNSTPQIQNGFNGSIWNSLENGIRDVIGSDTLYVVTGASFRKVGGSESITTINPVGDPTKDVPVPNYYWKVILKVKRNGSNITSAKAIGFWLEHKQYSSNNYESYAVSVDTIEGWTGFDFFVNLPESIEISAEKNTSWKDFQSF